MSPMTQSDRTDLIPSTPGRPAILRHEGWTVYVSIHDAAYLVLKREWKARIRASHPDIMNQPPVAGTARRGRLYTGAHFREVRAQYARWLHMERQWYWKLGGLMPPDHRGPAKPPMSVGVVSLRNRQIAAQCGIEV